MCSQREYDATITQTWYISRRIDNSKYGWQQVGLGMDWPNPNPAQLKHAPQCTQPDHSWVFKLRYQTRPMMATGQVSRFDTAFAFILEFKSIR